jgi:hypothetical protein
LKNDETISIILPTFNEKEILAELITKMFIELNKNNLNGEVIVVDDESPDGTGNLKKQYRVEVLHIKGKKGLSSAVIDGFHILVKPPADNTIEKQIQEQLKSPANEYVIFSVERHEAYKDSPLWIKNRRTNDTLVIGKVSFKDEFYTGEMYPLNSSEEKIVFIIKIIANHEKMANL